MLTNCIVLFLQGGGGYLLGVQTATILCITLWCAVLSFLVLQMIDLLVGLRFPFQEELLGADIVEHSIGPRKYDKIKGRLTDVSRARGYDLRRRKKYSASFRAAEHYLSQKEAGVLSVSEAMKPPSVARKIRKKERRDNNSPPYSNGPSIRNGECNGLSNGEIPLPSLHDGPSTGKPREIKRRGGGRNSMKRLHGALRRKEISRAPKWQQQLGVDNLAYLEQDEFEINDTSAIEAHEHSLNQSPKKVEFDANELAESDSSKYINDIAVIDVVPKRCVMVDSSTQTTDRFEQGQESTIGQTGETDVQEDSNGAETNMNLQFVTSVEFFENKDDTVKFNGTNMKTVENGACNIIFNESEIISEEYMV